MSRADRARVLRQRSGFAETVVWEALRAGRVEGLRFRRQHPIGRYVVDFACRELRLVIEIDGAVHDLPEVQARDRERTSELEAMGWTVLRFDNDLAVTRTTEIIEAVVRQARIVKGRDGGLF